MECKYDSYACNDRKLSELIDTLWNVNPYTARKEFLTQMELIDTLWNVNLFKSNGYSTGRQELIDTLWNVNRYLYVCQSGGKRELIDTLWNVNGLSFFSFSSSVGINRYIMECKLVRRTGHNFDYPN